jgi:enolase-phosphatase E1
MLWQDGYRSADFTAHIYPDAAEALRRWHAAGHALAVYSSGSVAAQKLFFGNSDAGDLLSLFDAFFDTEIGGKREAASYTRIAEALSRESGGILFLSDVVAELDAARDAGMRTVLVDRREDYPQPRIGAACNGHVRVESFAEIDVE